MLIEVLGKSNSWPDAGGACSGYLVTEEGYRLLLDCGHGVFAKLRQRCDPATIDAILISHLHPDHCLDLIPYSQYLSNGTTATNAPLPVYGPPGLLAFVAKLRDAGIGDAVEAVFELHEYDPVQPLRAGPFTVRFRSVPHFVETYAMRLESDTGDATYGADCRFCQELIELASGSDLLIAEATLGADDQPELGGAVGHMTAKQAGISGRRAGARQLLVTHFSDQLDRAQLAAAAQAGFDAPVKLASERLQVSVSRSGRVTDNVSRQSKPPTGATMFKGKTEDEAEVAAEAAEDPTAATGGSPIKGVLALIGLLLIGVAVALGVSKPLREKALDKLFGAEEQFDYTPPADQSADGAASTADASTEPTV